MLFLLAALSTLSVGVVEYVAMAPGSGAPGAGSSPIVKWVKLEYPSDAKDVSEVAMSLATSPVPELGAWYDLDLSIGGGTGMALTGKVLGDKLYAYVEKNAAGSTGLGCCADTLRIYDRKTGSSNVTEHDLDSILAQAFAGDAAATWKKATHTFDVELGADGDVYAYLMVQYYDGTIGTGQYTSITHTLAHSCTLARSHLTLTRLALTLSLSFFSRSLLDVNGNS